MDPVLEFGITAFISIFAIINPLSTIPVFLSLMKNEQLEERHKVAFRSSLVAFCVLVFFALTGFFLFQIYSITLEAFRIAGGVILFVIGMGMLFPKPQNSLSHLESRQSYLVPLAIPMTSGPGAITTAIVLASQATNAWLEITLWVAIFIACAINFFVLRYSDIIKRRVGEEGVMAMVKIMGLLVCAVGVQFMINGLKVAFPLLAGA
ncbi:MarC family integral membrane protein [uncultured archaeon]|nr:MarC family integral membrane protein [uncultured archaeon]